MAKELEKFKAAHKKAEPYAKKYSKAEGSKIKQRVTTASANCSSGEDYLVDCMVEAREKGGVTGNTFKDFMADKGFQEGLKLLDKAAGMLEDEVKALKAHCDKAAEGFNLMARLNNDIDKDLKKRKDSSESKKEIEKLFQTVNKQALDLQQSMKLYDAITPHARDYTKNFQKTVDKLLKQAPAAQKKYSEDANLPHQLTDKLIQSRTKLCIAGGKKVKELCDKAITAAETDLKKAQPHLKSAAAELRKIDEIVKTYTDVKKKYQANIDNSKDKNAIEKMIKSMQDSFATAERTLRGTSTTIKKAG